MTLYICNEILDYWDTKDYTPIHPISREMSLDRFQEFYMRVQLAGKEAICWYHRVWGLIAIKWWVNSLYVYFVISSLLGR
jgi:hypothetical protein